MNLACPVCKAENVGTTCRRCKADLAMLLNLEDRRSALLSAARTAYTQSRLLDAWRFVRAANEHRQDEESLRWLAMLQLLHGDFGEAWRAYRALNPHG
jgi:hypothetical protein